MFATLLKELKARWLTFFLGIIVVALVVAAFVIQRSLSQAAENEIHGLAHQLGNNMLIVPVNMNMIDFYSFKYGDAFMPENYPDRAQNSKAGEHIRLNRPALYGNAVKDGTDIVVIGSDMGMPEAPNHQERFPRTLITERFAGKFAVNPGSNYILNGVELNAARILPGDARLPDYGVMMSLADAQKILGRPGKINALYLGGCWCDIDIPALGKEIERSLPGTKAISVAGMIKAQKGVIAVMREYSGVFYAAALIIVSGVILTLILMETRRYRREIGILAAIGASRGAICAHCYIKAGIMGLAGGVAGFLLGAPLAGYICRTFAGMTISAGAELLMPVAGISLFSSFIGAAIPAFHLSRIDPVEALREV
ncbi:MAG: hypothetical protein A2W19_04515 [Spirochaetes bacterium RBG_16_49_21]|nr:MAG: hypothetical protein A2W19_04515 [Spirochaetes bacterium RBG_16_49_21]